MARKIKLKTVLSLIDKNTYLSLVVTKNRQNIAVSDELPRHKIVDKHKDLLSYDVVEISSDCEGIILIEIEKPVI